jgi:hypothetical protein
MKINSVVLEFSHEKIRTKRHREVNRYTFAPFHFMNIMMNVDLSYPPSNTTPKVWSNTRITNKTLLSVMYLTVALNQQILSTKHNT